MFKQFHDIYGAALEYRTFGQVNRREAIELFDLAHDG